LDGILAYLDNLECGGNVLLEVTTQPISRISELCVMGIFWIMTVASAIAMYKMKFSKVIAKIYGIISILGLILCGISLVFWSIDPSNDHICTIRWWTKTLGMVIFSGSVFCRSYQLKKIHQLIKSGRYQATKNVDHIRLLCGLMGMIVFVQLIILITLQLLLPLKSQIEIDDVVERVGEYSCNNLDNNAHLIWVTVQSIYLVCILLGGVYALYSTWGISSTVDDTRVNVIAIFLCLIALAVGDVVITYSAEDDKAFSWWAITLIMIWSLSMLCSVFLPRLIKIASRSTSDHSTTPAGVSTNTSAK
jgi:uncharacterized membrane protein YgdD (TMEM256/DUF423 family)